MNDLTSKEYAAFKATFEKEGIKYNTEAEYEEVARNLSVISAHCSPQYFAILIHTL